MENVEFKNKQLLSFLKSEKVLDEFIKNYEKQGIKKIEISDPKADIDNVLIWRSTNEGFSFWSLLHDKWLASPQYESFRKKFPSINGYQFRKMDNGFNLGCQHFTYSDLMRVANEMRKSPKSQTKVYISHFREVIITGTHGLFRGYNFTVKDINVLLRMYKLKQIKVEE